MPGFLTNDVKNKVAVALVLTTIPAAAFDPVHMDQNIAAETAQKVIQSLTKGVAANAQYFQVISSEPRVFTMQGVQRVMIRVVVRHNANTMFVSNALHALEHDMGLKYSAVNHYDDDPLEH